MADLLDHDYEVLNLDIQSPRDPGVAFTRVDFTDFGQTLEALMRIDGRHDGIDAIVHLAAIPGPGMVPNNRIFANNVISTYNVFSAARAAGVPLYSNLLALEDEHGIAVGVVHLPALGETVWAGRGLGCWSERGPARVNAHAICPAFAVSMSWNITPHANASNGSGTRSTRSFGRPRMTRPSSGSPRNAR